MLIYASGRYQLNLAGMQLPKKVECGIQLPAQNQRVDGSPALLHVGLLLSAEDGAAEHAAQWCFAGDRSAWSLWSHHAPWR